jgi:hypothetical protein
MATLWKFASNEKYLVSEVRLRIARSLANARGSDQSRDRKGAIAVEYKSVFAKGCT